jgi:hypothetical protein
MILRITILSHDLEDKKAGLKIQKFILIHDSKVKIQYSKITNCVLYIFDGDYPKDVEGVTYEDTEN